MPAKRKAEARRWLQQALYDLKAARWNIQGGFHDTACFLAQTGRREGPEVAPVLRGIQAKRAVDPLTHRDDRGCEEAGERSGRALGRGTAARSTLYPLSPLVIRTVSPAGTHTASTANQWRSKPWLQPNGSSQSSGTITRLKVMGSSWHRKTRLLNEH